MEGMEHIMKEYNSPEGRIIEDEFRRRDESHREDTKEQ